MAGSAVAGSKEYKFTNNNGKKADDLHIEFKGTTVTWSGTVPTQDPDKSFTEASGKGRGKVGLAAGESGKGVEDGGSVSITFEYPTNKAPTVKEVVWTFTNSTCTKFSEGEGMITETLESAWSGGAASGDGLYMIMLDGQEFPFQTVRGDLPEDTALRFAEYIHGLPWGLVLVPVLEEGGNRVVYTGLSYSNAWPNIWCQIVRQDRTQPMNVRHVQDAPCVGDTNGDGRTDQADLAAVLASFGSTCGEDSYNPDADVNDDLSVDQSDLAEVLASYGQNCEG